MRWCGVALSVVVYLSVVSLTCFFLEGASRQGHIVINDIHDDEVGPEREGVFGCAQRSPSGDREPTHGQLVSQPAVCSHR